MKITMALIAVLIGMPAMAQEQTMSSDQLYWTAKSIQTLQTSPPMASISRDGDVTIDWEQVEKTANDPAADHSGNWAYARLMLAIRNGTWKPRRQAPR